MTRQKKAPSLMVQSVHPSRRRRETMRVTSQSRLANVAREMTLVYRHHDPRGGGGGGRRYDDVALVLRSAHGTARRPRPFDPLPETVRVHRGTRARTRVSEELAVSDEAHVAVRHFFIS